MTNQPSMESSLAARIQKIAADLQSGVLPSTTENIMHLMGLKSDLEKARSARNAQMLMQPKAPTVKDQLLAGAQQEAGIASLPEYADGGVVGLAGGGDVGDIYEKMANGQLLTPDEQALVSGKTLPQKPTPKPLLSLDKQPVAQPATQQVEAEAAKDMMQQQAKKTQGELAGKPGVGSFVVAPKEKTATQALIEEATRDTSTQPAAPAMPAIPSLQSGMEEWQKAVGENKGIGATEERLRKLEAGTSDTKDRALWEGLMMAGLQRAGGANWGQAGMAGLGTWSEAQKEARKQEEKYFTIQNELEQAKRNELIQAAQYGGKARESALQRAAELEKVQFRAAAEMKQAEMSAKANMSVAQIYANRPTGGAGSATERLALARDRFEFSKIEKSIADTQKQLDSGLRNTIGFKDTPKYAELTNKLNNLNAQRDAMMSGAPTPSPADQPGQKLSAEQRAAMEKSVQAKLLR